MTARDFWLALSRGGRVEELDRSECLELLAAVSVGRLGSVNHVADQTPLTQEVSQKTRLVREQSGRVYRDNQIGRRRLTKALAPGLRR